MSLLTNRNSFLSTIAQLKSSIAEIQSLNWPLYVMNMDTRLQSVKKHEEAIWKERLNSSSLPLDLLKSNPLSQDASIDHRHPSFLDELLNALCGSNFRMSEKILVHNHQQLSHLVDRHLYLQRDHPPITDNIPPNLTNLFEFTVSFDQGWRKLQCKLMINEGKWLYTHWQSQRQTKTQVLQSYADALRDNENRLKYQFASLVMLRLSLSSHHQDGSSAQLALIALRSTFLSFKQVVKKRKLFGEAFTLYK
eukprot:CAMPEP_0117441092 /NCGR_PEP_ID=MMETSP0759-20121206/3450_1 /TAXON_ID=63605 /ORGANISM="Percolomonas cosmopolitus, Strain WS" /LENGTH=249 /DNA_ID=CAMNT_0005232923 /DNA_START=123 /DNA_END=869 /DNA_ORIENTATION=+